jgi:phenylalanyl-tRNA synthetase beta chain
VAALAALAGVRLDLGQLAAAEGPSFGWQQGHSAAAGEPKGSTRADALPAGEGWSARFGLLDVGLVKAGGIAGKVWAGTFAIAPERLAAGQARARYAELSTFPPALRDIALVVDQSASSEEVRRTLQKLAAAAAGGGFPVEAVALFDVFEGGGLPAGKKSLAFSLRYRSAERTLTDAEVNGAFTRLQESLGRETGFQVRK